MLKAVYYINQFYAGLGGEAMADVGLSYVDGPKGPATGVAAQWKGEMEVVRTLICGDNYVNTDTKYEEMLPEFKRLIEEVEPDVFIAGPAFNAGRYGVACAKVCDYVRSELHIPSVTAMWWENPAIGMYGKDNYIFPTTETAAGMRKSIGPMSAFALKMAKKEPAGPARIDGYFRTGHRYNEYHEQTGAQRVVEMLMKKLNGKPYTTEVPLRGFEQIPAAEKNTDLSHTTIALITTGGLVPVGNPDKLKQAFADNYGKYDMTGLNALEKGVYESIHGGYDTTDASNDPHRLVPLDEMRELEKEGIIGGVYKDFYTLCGVGTNVDNSKAMGKRMADELKAAGVGAVFLTST